MTEEDNAATNFSSKLYRTERNDRYGPLISALFEVSPSGAPGFVTSTPKQARTAVGNLDSSQTIHDTADKFLPRSKEKRRYEKEWTVTVPRNRRNTSLGGVNTKALPSSSSSTHSLYIDTSLGQWFSEEPLSQSSSLDTLASYYCGTPDKRPTVKNAKPQKPIICDARITGGGSPKPTPHDVSLAGSMTGSTSNPDFLAHGDHSASTRSKSALVWEKLEKRNGGHVSHNRSHSLASPPSSTLKRRQTSRRHAIYGGTGIPGIPVPYDDPEETRVNPSRATIASFDSNKAVCAASEDSFSESPRKGKESFIAGLASVSPAKHPALPTPERVRRFFDVSTDGSSTHYCDMSITAVSSGSFDDNIDFFGSVKTNIAQVLPLKIRSKGRRTQTSVDGVVSRPTTLEETENAFDPATLEHLPLMHELLDLVEEATKSWQLL